MENQQNQPSQNASSFQDLLNKMENFFNLYLHEKAPFHIPAKAKEIIVNFSPWITILFLVLSIPVALIAWGFSFVVLPFIAMFGTVGGFKNIAYSAVSIVTWILMIMALPGLFSKTLKGWRFVYYSCLVSALAQLFMGQIFGMLFGLVISLYILFEIKEYYH